MGDVYVTDNGHKVIDKFSSTGAYIGQITTGKGSAAFTELYGVAVGAAGRTLGRSASPGTYKGLTIDNYSDALTNGFVASREAAFACYDDQSASRAFAIGPEEDDLYIQIAGGVEQVVWNWLDGELEHRCQKQGAMGSAGHATAATVNLSSNDLYVRYRRVSLGPCG